MKLRALAVSAAAWPERFNNIPLVDANCAGKVKANPDAHTRACELQCQKSGLGIITADGNFLKFDAKGNTEAIQLLSKSTKADHLRVNVTGTVADGTLAVQSISIKEAQLLASRRRSLPFGRRPPVFTDAEDILHASP